MRWSWIILMVVCSCSYEYTYVTPGLLPDGGESDLDAGRGNDGAAESTLDAAVAADAAPDAKRVVPPEDAAASDAAVARDAGSDAPPPDAGDAVVGDAGDAGPLAGYFPPGGGGQCADGTDAEACAEGFQRTYVQEGWRCAKEILSYEECPENLHSRPIYPGSPQHLCAPVSCDWWLEEYGP